MKIGITGHQNLESNETWVRDVLREIIVGLKAQEGLTSLARGTDQIFAGILSDLRLPYVAVIPCSLYVDTFESPAIRKQYLAFLKKASRVMTLNLEKPEGIAFYEAGKKVVELSDRMIAVWDGQKAKHLGGTADAVEYSLAIKREIIHINPVTRKISNL